MDGQQADGSPDGERSLSAMGIYNHAVTYATMQIPITM